MSEVKRYAVFCECEDGWCKELAPGEMMHERTMEQYYIDKYAGNDLTGIMVLASDYDVLQQRVATLEGELAALTIYKDGLKADAERYRWLRNWHTRLASFDNKKLPTPPWVVRSLMENGTPTMSGLYERLLDTAIDEEMTPHADGAQHD